MKKIIVSPTLMGIVVVAYLILVVVVPFIAMWMINILLATEIQYTFTNWFCCLTLLLLPKIYDVKISRN